MMYELLCYGNDSRAEPQPQPDPAVPLSPLWRTPLFSQKPFSPNRQDTPVLLICHNGLQAGVFQPFIGSIWAEALLETGHAEGHYRLMSFQKQRLTVNAVNFWEFKTHYDKCCTAFVTQKKKISRWCNLSLDFFFSSAVDCNDSVEWEHSAVIVNNKNIN